jgi:cytosine deaminase
MVTNPLDNSVLQGRFDAGPVRRGHTRVKELVAAGVNVAIGNDSVMDPWYPLGYGDPAQAAFVLAHFAHMSGATELPYLLEMITTNPARALGVDAGGIRTGGPASLVVFDAPTPEDALRRVTPRFLVLRDGAVVARTQPARTTVTALGVTRDVTFLRP